jgi:hypothetical protein
MLGVASSSGKFGHSFSYGKADLVTVISEDPCLADAFATAIANKIHSKEDAEKMVNEVPKGVIALFCVMDNRLYYKGPFEFVQNSNS